MISAVVNYNNVAPSTKNACFVSLMRKGLLLSRQSEASDNNLTRVSYERGKGVVQGDVMVCRYTELRRFYPSKNKQTETPPEAKHSSERPILKRGTVMVKWLARTHFSDSMMTLDVKRSKGNDDSLLSNSRTTNKKTPL